MLSDHELCKKLKKQRENSKRGLIGQYDNTQKCIEFYNGDTMSYEDRIQFIDDLEQPRRATVQFSKVQSNVDAVVGFMAQNRRQARFIARLNGSKEQSLFSRYVNAIYGYHRENMNADQIETDQDADMMINGYGATETDLSYIAGNATTDPNGEIVKLRLDPMRVGWDSAARAKNLLDSRWVYYFEDFDLKDALDLFQGSKKDDFEQVDDTSIVETGYEYNPWGGLYDKIRMEDSVEWSSKSQEMVRVYNHQWMEYETFYRANNPIYMAPTQEEALYWQEVMASILPAMRGEAYGPNGMMVTDMFEFDPWAEILTFTAEQKRVLVDAFGDLIEAEPFKRKCFYTAVYSGEHIFSKFKSISQQGFSVKFKTGIYNASKNIWTGMVNAMMQPAEYYNKALTELMFTIAANSKGGVLIEEDAIEDISEIEDKWAKTDAVIKVRSGAISGNKIMQKSQGAVPTGLEGIIQLSASAINENGVDPSFVGNIDKENQSGILYKRRIRQVISKMARYFDSITLYQKEDARLCADLIKVWVENNNGQFVRITGEDGAEEFYLISQDNMAAEYDISIQEAAQTPEDKQETATVLGMYADKLAATGNVQAASTFYAESLQYLPIDGDVRNRLTQALQPNNEMVPAQMVQQLQQRIQELEGRITQANIAKLESEVALNQEKIKSTAAQTVKYNADAASVLEDAARTGLENDLLRQGKYDSVGVSI